MIKNLFVLLLCLLTLSHCALNTAPPEQPPKSGVTVTHFDMTERPQDDFYRFVNGNWLAETKIPDDKSNYGVFSMLEDQAHRDVLEIVKQAASANDPAQGSNTQKVGDLFNSYMDTQTLNRLGWSPLKKELAKIDALTDKRELAAYFAYAQTIGSNSPFTFYVNNDLKRPDQYSVYLVHTGLGLPDRDYYLNTGEKYQDIRKAYHDHITAMFDLAGWQNDAPVIETIVAIETKIAAAHWTKSERRQREKTYNPHSFAELSELAPRFYWDEYAHAAGLQTPKQLIVRTPSFYSQFSDVFAETSLNDWKLYQRWQLLNHFSPLLGEQLERQNFEFYEGTLSGKLVPEERWQRGVKLVNRHLGEVVGKEYVAAHFSPLAKQRMIELVENLRRAYHDSILQLDWMGESTKAQAIEKLQKFNPKIGYPDKWKDYSSLTIQANDLLGNVIRANQFSYQYELNKIGKPIDRDEWFMTPQRVNAYYNPNMNEIVFPAAILQPPFFDLQADDAVNYGAIGSVIGHEMGHGFDDQGSKSDGDGVLRNWWTESDLKEFKARTKKLIEQYNQYEALPGEFVDGELTQGENIGDLGGVTIAYQAYLMSLQDNKPPVLDGFTGQQRFFIGWAQVWPRLYREQELHRRLTLDPHSPSEYRVNGIVRNMPEFYSAFNVKEGDKLFLPPEERVKIW